MSIVNLSADLRGCAPKYLFFTGMKFSFMSFLLYCQGRTLYGLNVATFQGCLASGATFELTLYLFVCCYSSIFFWINQIILILTGKTSYWVKKGAAVTTDEGIRVSGQSPVTQNAQSHIDWCLHAGQLFGVDLDLDGDLELLEVLRGSLLLPHHNVFIHCNIWFATNLIHRGKWHHWVMIVSHRKVPILNYGFGSHWLLYLVALSVGTYFFGVVVLLWKDRKILSLLCFSASGLKKPRCWKRPRASRCLR